MTDNPFRRLDPRFSVAPQLTADDVASAAAAGFKVLVCNRPDGEQYGQPSTASLRATAEAAGLQFVDLPFSGADATPAQVKALAALLAQSDEPVLAFCRSGTRSTFLWSTAQVVTGRPFTEVVQAAAGAGYDMGAYKPIIDMLARASAD
jgi:uncharacterized protein (TIGR01244 family)